MKLVQINATCGVGSTGKIAVGIGRQLTASGIENYILYSCRTDGDASGISCANKRFLKLQALKARVFGGYGFYSRRATKRMIKALEEIKPDVVHLHNLHGHDCHLGMLLSYLKEKKIKVVWTFHDCWSFTGYCTHFDSVGCDKWKTECRDCPQRRSHSWFLDRSHSLFLKKKQLIDGLDLTVVAPSRWLYDRIKESFFGDFDVKVIYNGIDLSVFCPIENRFRERHGIDPNKKMVLGVAFDWGPRKGLDVFLALAQMLDRERYQIVLVGTNDELDKTLPKEILSIHKTQDQHELAEIYSAADVFVNPTREEVLGLTNIEANACGTPVITFRTGGSPECITPTSGTVVEQEDLQGLTRAIRYVCEDTPFDASACREAAKKFDKTERFAEYVRLYESFNLK